MELNWYQTLKEIFRSTNSQTSQIVMSRTRKCYLEIANYSPVGIQGTVKWSENPKIVPCIPTVRIQGTVKTSKTPNHFQKWKNVAYGENTVKFII